MPVAYTVPNEDAPPIRYPVAVVRGLRQAEAARFVEYLFSPAAAEIFTRAGVGTEFAGAAASEPEEKEDKT